MTTEALPQLIDAFEAVCDKYAHVGAADTEPDWVFQSLLWDAAAGEQPEIPNDARGWQLYTTHELPKNPTEKDIDAVSREIAETDAAASELHAAAAAVVLEIERHTIAQIGSLRKYLKKICWRLPV